MTPIALVAAALPAIADRGYKLVAQGLIITRDLTVAEWEALGRHLAEVTNRTSWALGDWLIAGKSGADERGADYGYAKVITGRSYESLSQMVRVARAFPIEQRSAPLPWSFYREVLRLDVGERAHALRVAAANRWTRDDLADYITGRGAPVTATAEPRASAAAASTRDNWKAWNAGKRNRNHRTVTCPSCGFKWDTKKRLP